MKAITPIISVILLVFLTIALSSVATEVFIDASEDSAVQAQENIETEKERSTKRYTVIDVTKTGSGSSDDVTVLIKNTGSFGIKEDDISIVIGTTIKKCQAIEPNEIVFCEIENVANECGDKAVLVSGPVNTREYDC